MIIILQRLVNTCIFYAKSNAMYINSAATFYKLLFRALFATFFSLIQALTVSDRVKLPPSHTITAGMTHRYSPFIVTSIHANLLLRGKNLNKTATRSGFGPWGLDP
jgi:hypothetical protein